MIDNPANRCPAAVIELLRYLDVLTAIVDQLKIKSLAARLHDLGRMSTDNGVSVVAQMPRIVQTTAGCMRTAEGQLQQLLSVAKIRAEQRERECNRLEAELSQARIELQRPSSPDAQKQAAANEQAVRNELIRVREFAEREYRYLASLQDCHAEVDWCRRGMSDALDAIKTGGRPMSIQYPTRSFRAGAEYQNWVDSLGTLSQAVGGILPDYGRQLRMVLDRLRSRTATVTFGGRFKSGKSSLVNAALGRALLPTKDLPETGANCYLSAGTTDDAELVSGGKHQRISCTTKALREAISLRGGRDGTERTASVNRLNIRVTGFPGGNNARWIDPPGMFDRPEMTERAWQAARDADVMVWVFRSLQFLGEAEVEAIGSHIRERGPAAVVFVENAFLPTDKPDPWTYHMTEIVPVDRGKLAKLAQQLGVEPDQMPPLFIMSAEKVLQHGHGFGAGELRRLLGQLAGPDCPLILRARWQWAERTLSRAAEAMRAEWTRAKADMDARRSVAEQELQRNLQRRRRFETAVCELVAHSVSAIDSVTPVIAETVSMPITTSSLVRDKTYEMQLHSRFSEHAGTLVESLIDEVGQKAAEYGQGRLTVVAATKLRQLWNTDAIPIEVANNAVHGGAIAAGASAGAAAGVWVFGIGAVVGAVVGGTIAAMGTSQTALEQDCVDTKSRIKSAAVLAVAGLRERQQAMLAVILDACELPPSPLLSDNSDRQKVELLFGLYQQLDAATRKTADWIRREATL